MTKIAIDIDGVLADFEDRAFRLFGDCDRSLYSFEKRWTGKDISAYIRDESSYFNLDPIPGSAEGDRLMDWSEYLKLLENE